MKCEFLIQHSRRVKKNFSFSRPVRAALPVLAAALLFLAAPMTSQAQMFSVGDDRETRLDIPRTAVFLGLEPAEFEFKGTGTGRFGFDGTLLRLRVETAALNFFLATGGSITGMDLSYFDAGIQSGYSLSLLSSEKFRLQVPLQLMANVTSVVNSDIIATTSQFKMGGIVIGLGPEYSVRISERLRHKGRAVASTGFAFATGGTFGGSLRQLEAQFRLYADRLFGNIGLSVGYDYLFKGYNIELDEYDYDFSSGSFLIGLTF